jgi:DNA-binding response OmpR family regulator
MADGAPPVDTAGDLERGRPEAGLRDSQSPHLSRSADSAVPRSMVVCDDPELSAAIVRAAAGSGWNVESFCTADAAVRRLGERSFDVLTVCGADGRGVAAAAGRLHAAVPAAPLLVMTPEATTPVRALAARSAVSELVPWSAGPAGMVAAWDMHCAARRGSPRILVASGDRPAQTVAAEALAAAGCTVRALGDAACFFEELAAWSPEAVWLDLSAPAPGAWDLLHALRAAAEWRGIPILLTGDRIDPGERLRAYAAGADAVIELAGSPVELTAFVRTRVRRARLLGAAAAPPPAGTVAPAPARAGSRTAGRVVLVEGSPTLAAMLRYASAPVAKDAMVFHDGRAALAWLLSDEAPREALVVFDLDLPGIDAR